MALSIARTKVNQPLRRLVPAVLQETDGWPADHRSTNGQALRMNRTLKSLPSGKDPRNATVKRYH